MPDLRNHGSCSCKNASVTATEEGSSSARRCPDFVLYTRDLGPWRGACKAIFSIWGVSCTLFKENRKTTGVFLAYSTQVAFLSLILEYRALVLALILPSSHFLISVAYVGKQMQVSFLSLCHFCTTDWRFLFLHRQWKQRARGSMQPGLWYFHWTSQLNMEN